MPRKKQNLLLQPRLPGLEFEPPPRPLHTVVTVTSHLIKPTAVCKCRCRKRPAAWLGRPRCANAVAGKGQPQQSDQPASLRWVRDRLATAGVTQQPEGER